MTEITRPKRRKPAARPRAVPSLREHRSIVDLFAAHVMVEGRTPVTTAELEGVHKLLVNQDSVHAAALLRILTNAGVFRLAITA